MEVFWKYALQDFKEDVILTEWENELHKLGPLYGIQNELLLVRCWRDEDYMTGWIRIN